MKLGRPTEQARSQAFLEVARYLEENDDEQITINDLVSHMDDILADSKHCAYTCTHTKEKLKEHFGDRLMQSNINGKPNVITFRHTANEILHEFHQSNKKSDPDAEKIKIIETAGKIIKDEIKSVATSPLHYPIYSDLTSVDECVNYLPETLRVLLGIIIAGKDTIFKVASIGQAIMQACRPRVLLAPLQLGLGIQLHHHFSSRFLIDSLHHHGFCSSYNDVQQFEGDAAFTHNVSVPNFTTQFMQNAADNVDHNIWTIDGNDTFHGMGMISMITPGAFTKGVPIPKGNITYSNIAKFGRIPIHYYQEQSKGINSLKYEPLLLIKTMDPTAPVDTLWKASILFQNPRPAW